MGIHGNQQLCITAHTAVPTAAVRASPWTILFSPAEFSSSGTQAGVLWEYNLGRLHKTQHATYLRTECPWADMVRVIYFSALFVLFLYYQIFLIKFYYKCWELWCLIDYFKFSLWPAIVSERSFEDSEAEFQTPPLDHVNSHVPVSGVHHEWHAMKSTHPSWSVSSTWCTLWSVGWCLSHVCLMRIVL